MDLKKERIYVIFNGYNTERNKLLIMEINKLIKKTLNATAIWFTIIMAGYMLILQIMNVGEDSAAVESFRVLLIFLFALLFSIANTIRSSTGIHSVLRHILHYLITVFAFYACFMLPVDMRQSFMITGVIIFTVAYLIVIGIIAIFSARLKANREKNTVYSNQFNKKK